MRARHAEIARGDQAIAAVTGRCRSAFARRATTITDTVFEALTGSACCYDSSVFPCPAYYVAKAAAIASYKLRKRPTHSVVDDPRVLTAPAEPYRIGNAVP